MKDFIQEIQKTAFADGDRQVDWKLVADYINENKNSISSVEVGLAEDWACTQATIFEDGEFCFKENHSAGFYGASWWATPAIKVYDKNYNRKTYETWELGTESSAPGWLRQLEVDDLSDYDEEEED